MLIPSPLPLPRGQNKAEGSEGDVQGIHVLEEAVNLTFIFKETASHLHYHPLSLFLFRSRQGRKAERVFSCMG